MSVEWLQPSVWWGLGLVAIPIVVHLLARHRSRRVRFPSLRFMPVTQMAALRRRVITDWPLLLIRALVLVAAVAAVAGPVFVSDARRETWDQRVARAVVVTSSDDDAIRAIAADEADTSFTSAEFAAPFAADALRDAREWLRTQPPGSREIVVVGDLREGALTAHDLGGIPQHVGLRFLPVTGSATEQTVQWRAVGDTPQEAAAVYTVHVTPEMTRTKARYVAERERLVPGVELLTPPDDQEFADALLRAVLREGVVIGEGADRRIRLAFQGAVPAIAAGEPPSKPWMREVLERVADVRGGEADGVLLLTTTLPVTDARAPRLVADVLHAAYADARHYTEPRRISAATLAAWSRPPGGSPPDVLPADEGDRRWFWGAVLLLLAVEHLVRRRRVA